MLGRAKMFVLGGLAVMAVGMLVFEAVPVLAEEPGEELSPSPSADPSLTPSSSISSPASSSADASPTPLPTPSMEPTPTPTASPSLSDEDPVMVDEPREVVGVTARGPVFQAAGTASAAAIDDEFRPTPLTVTAGTTVVWTNEGQNPHTVTANDRAFDSGTLAAGQTFTVTFDQVGQVPYYCQIHGEPGSGMTGLVIVQAAPGEGDEEPPASGSGGLPATGVDPIPLVIVALVLVSLGLAALRASRRATDERR